MLVVKTTSPATSPSPAKLRPSKAAPSSRTRVALLCPWLCTYSKRRSSPVVYRLSANYSSHDPARQGPSEIGGVGRAAEERIPPYRPFLREVDERQVRRRADGQSPTTTTDPPAWGAANRLEEPCEREAAAEDQIG